MHKESKTEEFFFFTNLSSTYWEKKHGVSTGKPRKENVVFFENFYIRVVTNENRAMTKSPKFLQTVTKRKTKSVGKF